MLRFLTDEDFDNDILRGLLRRHSGLDMVRVQDIGLMGQPDPQVLEWAAQERRVLLTHDANTMTREAYARVQNALSMPGIVIVSHTLALGRVIEEILLLAEGASESDVEGRVLYLPL